MLSLLPKEGDCVDSKSFRQSLRDFSETQQVLFCESSVESHPSGRWLKFEISCGLESSFLIELKTVQVEASNCANIAEVPMVLKRKELFRLQLDAHDSF
jgi:hypothetical protein